MNKNLAAVLIAIVALAGLGAVAFVNQSNETTDNQTTSSQTAQTTTQPATGTTNQQPENTSTQHQNTEEVMIDIEDFAYQPEQITIKKGTTITWTNRDQTRHDVTPDEPNENFQGSELLGQGESYSFTFDTVGTYTYFCSPHPYMTATVEVVE